MFVLVVNVLFIALAGVMLLGGVALLVIGIVLVARARSLAPHASYSDAVVDPSGSRDGTGLPLDFEDRPQWAAGLGADDVGPPVDPADADAVQRLDQRRRGMATAGVGLVLAVIGLVALLMSLAHVLAR